MITKERINQVIEVLKQGWCAYFLAMDGDGNSTQPLNPLAVKWCLRGAIIKVFGGRGSHWFWKTKEAEEFDNELSLLLPGGYFSDTSVFNNSQRSVEPVIAFLTEVHNSCAA